MKTFKQFLKESVLSKESILEWLKEHDFYYNENKYKINGETVDVQNDVKLFNVVGKIPFQFGKVAYDFDCSNNQLTSLEGSPKEVGGSFWCQNNKLKNLKGSPSKVGNYYMCSNNDLVSLEGCPKEINDGFDCSSNKLSTLKFGPQKINGDFDCSNNQLKDLKFGPTYVKGPYNCMSNKLISLEGLGKVGKSLFIVDNPNLQIDDEYIKNVGKDIVKG